MRLITSHSQFQVLDDVLPAPAFAGLQRLLAEAPFDKVHQPGRGYAWRAEDGEPEATAVCFHDDPLPWAVPLFDALLPQADALKPLVGEQGRDWKALSARAVRHAAGSGLSWHTDDRGYAAAWVYFAHPEWDCHWGGELLVADPSCRGRQWRQSPPENVLLTEVGVGSYIFPKPNRLVVIAGGHMHRVSPVTPEAGGHARATLSGFFLRSVQSSADRI